MRRLFHGLILGVALFCLGVPARAVTINVNYDASVSNSMFFPQIQAALGVVSNTFHVLFTNSSSVNVTCYWGAAGPFSGGVSLGENECVLGGPFSYAEITNALRNLRNSANDSNAVASLPASDPIATNNWWLPRAQAKGLNLGTNNLNQLFFSNRTDTNNDGSIAFASDVLYTFSATNRAVVNHYDFIGVAEHELSEVMGRSYALNTDPAGVYLPYDLFRFTNSGARNFNPDATNAYFSVNNGTNNLKWFCEDYATTGDDPQDWQPGAAPDAFDTAANAGVILPLTPVDLAAMDIIGYNLPSFSPAHLKLGVTNKLVILSFTNVASAPFSVYVATNLTMNITNWTYLGAPMENPPGQYQFVVGPAAPRQAKFYRVSLP